MRILNLIVLYKVDPTAMANLCIIYKSIKKVIEFFEGQRENRNSSTFEEKI